MENRTASGSDPHVAKGRPSDGVSGQQNNGASADEARRQAMQRAEELADRLGEQIGHYVSSFGRGILRWVARAREEAEDIWAEAQDLRARRRAAHDQSEGAPPTNG